MTVSMHGLDLAGIEWNHRRTAPDRIERPRSERAFHYISDHQPDTWHPHTGKVVASKSQFRKMTREAGCVEVGNEYAAPASRPKEPMPRAGHDIKRAIEQLKAGYRG